MEATQEYSSDGEIDTKSDDELDSNSKSACGTPNRTPEPLEIHPPKWNPHIPDLRLKLPRRAMLASQIRVPNKNDNSSPKPLLGKMQVKQRLHAFTLTKKELPKIVSPLKQLKRLKKPVENGEDEVKKKSKLAMNPQEKAKAVISEIEELKKQELERLRASDSMSPPRYRSRRSRKRDSKGFNKKSKRKRSKSRTPGDDDKTRRSKRKSKDRSIRERSRTRSPSPKSRVEVIKPKVLDMDNVKSWKDMRKMGYRLAEMDVIKMPPKRYEKVKTRNSLDYLMNGFDGEVYTRECFIATSIYQTAKFYCRENLKYTVATPSVSYSENLLNPRIYPNRSQFFNMVPKNRAECARDFLKQIESSMPKQSDRKTRKQQSWYPAKGLVEIVEVETPSDSQAVVHPENKKVNDKIKHDKKVKKKETTISKLKDLDNDYDIQTPDTDEYRSNWEIDDESLDEHLTPPKKNKKVKNKPRKSKKLKKKIKEKKEKRKSDKKKTKKKKSKKQIRNKSEKPPKVEVVEVKERPKSHVPKFDLDDMLMDNLKLSQSLNKTEEIAAESFSPLGEEQVVETTVVENSWEEEEPEQIFDKSEWETSRIAKSYNWEQDDDEAFMPSSREARWHDKRTWKVDDINEFRMREKSFLSQETEVVSQSESLPETVESKPKKKENKNLNLFEKIHSDDVHVNGIDLPVVVNTDSKLVSEYEQFITVISSDVGGEEVVEEVVEKIEENVEESNTPKKVVEDDETLVPVVLESEVKRDSSSDSSSSDSDSSDSSDSSSDSSSSASSSSDKRSANTVKEDPVFLNTPEAISDKYPIHAQTYYLKDHISPTTKPSGEIKNISPLKVNSFELNKTKVKLAPLAGKEDVDFTDILLKKSDGVDVKKEGVEGDAVPKESPVVERKRSRERARSRSRSKERRGDYRSRRSPGRGKRSYSPRKSREDTRRYSNRPRDDDSKYRRRSRSPIDSRKDRNRPEQPRRSRSPPYYRNHRSHSIENDRRSPGAYFDKRRSPERHNRDLVDRYRPEKIDGKWNSDPILANHMDYKQSPNSPVDGLKRSIADSTISDSELVNQTLNVDDSRHTNKKRKYDCNVAASPIGSPKRPSLDDRINQVLGIEKEEPKPIESVYSQGTYDYGYYDNYSGYPPGNYEGYHHHHPHGPPMNMVPPGTYAYPPPVYPPETPHPPVHQGSQVVQVGNVLQVVPTEMPLPKPPQPSKKPEEVKEPKNQVVQVGNMLQIVPTVLPVPSVKIKTDEETVRVVETVEVQTKIEAPPQVVTTINSRKAEKLKRRQERALRRKERELKRAEKQSRQAKRQALKAERLIKKALTKDISGPPDLDVNDINESIDDENVDEKTVPTMWPPHPPLPVVLPQPPSKGILVKTGFSKLKTEASASPSGEVTPTDSTIIRKTVKFADGIRPGEGTSPSGGEDLPSPPPPKRKLPKEQRYKKTKIRTKKKVKVKVVREIPPPQPVPVAPEIESDSDDNLPPPPPPPGSPPPHLWPPKHTIKLPPNFIPGSLPPNIPYPMPPVGVPRPIYPPPVGRPGPVNMPPGPINMPPGPINIPPGPINIPPGPINIPPGQPLYPPPPGFLPNPNTGFGFSPGPGPVVRPPFTPPVVVNGPPPPGGMFHPPAFPTMSSMRQFVPPNVTTPPTPSYPIPPFGTPSSQ